MTYVLSDIHGDYDSYQAMLSLINFSDADKLFIIGDICDRGSDCAKIYIDVMSRGNIIALKGNHELMAEQVLPYLFGFEKPKSKISFQENYFDWLGNGADSTIASLSKQNDEVVYDIINFIRNMPYYATVKVREKEFTLVHAGLDYFDENSSLESYDPFLLVWTRPDYNETLWKDKNKRLIVGHTPTIFLSENGAPKIFHGSGSIINIDCGNAYRALGGRLGCLCLDTMEEFYI